jgi:hypothetical protein
MGHLNFIVVTMPNNYILLCNQHFQRTNLKAFKESLVIIEITQTGLITKPTKMTMTTVSFEKAYAHSFSLFTLATPSYLLSNL